METVKFSPNEEDIAKRAEIKPYGRAAAYETEDPVPIQFILENPEISTNQAHQDSQPQTAYSAPSIYVPPAVSNYKYTLPTEISIRVTNIPTRLTSREFYDLVLKKCGRVFNRCSLILDKQTNQSRGLAYITCENVEKAKEIVKDLKTIVIDSLVFSAEIVTDR